MKERLIRYYIFFTNNILSGGNHMNIKEQLYYLIREYLKENYTTNIFCEQFTNIYCQERHRANLSKLEDMEFDNLNDVTSRYSEFDEDIKMYPGVYFTDEDVRKKVEEVYKKLQVESSGLL